jgi:hypothetical protein
MPIGSAAGHPSLAPGWFSVPILPAILYFQISCLLNPEFLPETGSNDRLIWL